MNSYQACLGSAKRLELILTAIHISAAHYLEETEIDFTYIYFLNFLLFYMMLLKVFRKATLISEILPIFLLLTETESEKQYAQRKFFPS